MIDNLYPSALRKPTKYSGKLAKKRPYKEPPRSGEEYPTAKLRGLASSDYDADMQKYSDEQTHLDLEGMRLLADHYGVEFDVEDGGEFWMRIAINLARDHVPWFQMEGKRGRPRVWTEEAYALLLVRVIELKKQGNTIEQSLKNLKPKYRHIEDLEQHYNDANKMAASGKSQYTSQFFKVTEDLPLESVEKTRLLFEAVVDQITVEDEKWMEKGG